MSENGRLGMAVYNGAMPNHASHPAPPQAPQLAAVPQIHLSEATRAFIDAHEGEDARDLALHAKRDEPGLDLPFALDQIAGRRIARTKLPAWAACDDVVYPAHVPMEQCSSQSTAHIKAQLARECIADSPHPTRIVDLTGGLGVDFWALAQWFDEAVYVERLPHLCALAAHNLHALGVRNARVECADGTGFLRAMPPATMIYVDPARRDAHGSRTYAIEDCTPDVLALRGELLAKAPVVMVKLSPMLDWRKAVADFQGAVQRVAVVSTGNECKELLLVLTRAPHGDVRVDCVNDGDVVTFTTAEDQRPSIAPAGSLGRMRYLMEPNASIMKAGAFAALQRQRPGLAQIGPNSHLFVSEQPVGAVPGRAFEIVRTGTMNKRELKALLAGVTHANIAVRNFPLTAPQLRKKLKLKDGGNDYLFATTDAGGRHVLILARKAPPAAA